MLRAYGHLCFRGDELFRSRSGGRDRKIADLDEMWTVFDPGFNPGGGFSRWLVVEDTPVLYDAGRFGVGGKRPCERVGDYGVF